jgi:hypothetical protein
MPCAPRATPRRAQPRRPEPTPERGEGPARTGPGRPPRAAQIRFRPTDRLGKPKQTTCTFDWGHQPSAPALELTRLPSPATSRPGFAPKLVTGAALEHGAMAALIEGELGSRGVPRRIPARTGIAAIRPAAAVVHGDGRGCDGGGCCCPLL